MEILINNEIYIVKRYGYEDSDLEIIKKDDKYQIAIDEKSNVGKEIIEIVNTIERMTNQLSWD